MAKTKVAYFCQNCGAQYAKWVGQCTSCKQWNTVVEEVVQKTSKPTWNSSKKSSDKTSRPVPVYQITNEAENRLNMLDEEFNRVLGGGLVPGSLTLLGGEPGIGKSTLLLQIALKLSIRSLKIHLSMVDHP